MTDCSNCPVAESGRRAYLRELGMAAAGVAVALGIAPSCASALPVNFVRALSSTGRDRAYPIPAADGVQIDKDESVIIARAGNKVFAFSLACPHQNTALRWDGDNNRFQCPKHKSKYQPDGTFISGRATRGMDRFAVRRDGANLIVDLERLYEQDDNPAEWAAAVVTL
jgi:Rieske Fe-S protein